MKELHERESEHSLSVADAVREVMESTASSAASVSRPRDLPTAGQPHLPLRKASARKLQHEKRPTPTPVWVPAQQQVRGLNPGPVQALPHMANVTASSEHAFAGRNENQKKPFKPPLGVEALGYGHKHTDRQYGG